MKSTIKNKAFTLIELMLVISIIGVFGYFSTSIINGFFIESNLENSKAKLINNLISSRFMAFNNGTDEIFSLYSTYYIPPGRASVELEDGVTLSPAPMVFNFNKLGGTNAPLTFYLNTVNNTIEIHINSLGRISWIMK